ncbi:MAG TPA: tRNA pseudouridine(55) synthase TruB [Thermomicrobiaceae bacterium]|nr:tRNA pseudouridine(55) synthase TruB [Thermomicrobiaceae bacterium]
MGVTAHGFLIVDKPRGWTSHDVVARVRRLLGTRRVGHAGTLDPAAEGVLVVGVGSATRLLEQVQSGAKQYVAHVVLGVESDSGDVEGLGSAIASRPPDRAAIEAALQTMVGEIRQVPPAHSAIKVGGEALYRRARRGEVVEVPARTVHVSTLAVLDYRPPDVVVRVDCGSGVYVRAIARDLGRDLGCGAYLHALLRTRVGAFTLQAAWPMEDLERGLTPPTWPLMALHPDAALQPDDALALGGAAVESWYHGRPVPIPEVTEETTPRVRGYTWDGDWLGVASTDQARGLWQPRAVVGR